MRKLRLCLERQKGNNIIDNLEVVKWLKNSVKNKIIARTYLLFKMKGNKMNFQAVECAGGALVTMTGCLMEIGALKTNSKGNPYASCKVMDSTGVTHSVTINAGKTGLPTVVLLGKPCIFALQTYQGQNGLRFSGFCNGLASQNSVTPQFSPQPTPQFSQQQAYRQNMQQRLQTPQNMPQPAPHKPEPDWDAKDLRMAKMNALTNATNLITTLAELMGKPEECTPANVKVIAMTFVDFVYGKTKKPEDMTTAELLDTPAEADDIPFDEAGSYAERN